MTAIPADTPVTLALALPDGVTDATLVLLLVQVPEVYGSLNGMVFAMMTVLAPVMVPASGVVLMVTTRDVEQPVVARNVMVVVPPDIPVTKPDDTPMVATPVLLLVQETPLPEGHSRIVVVPTQAKFVPVMAEGSALDVKVVVLVQVLGAV